MTPAQRAVEELDRAMLKLLAHEKDCPDCPTKIPARLGSPPLIARCNEGSILHTGIFFAHGVVSAERRFQRRKK